MKVCHKCKNTIPISEFYKDKNQKDGLAHYCKYCHLKYKNTIKGKTSRRNTNLKNNYNITINDYDQILESQNYVCKICKTNSPGGQGRFHVDHDHKTGKVRGLLCDLCNHGLGNFKDSISTLSKAIQYLSENDK